MIHQWQIVTKIEHKWKIVSVFSGDLLCGKTSYLLNSMSYENIIYGLNIASYLILVEYFFLDKSFFC
jgi:hypothetical protein